MNLKNDTLGESNLYYRVVAGSYKNKDNAGDMVKELKNKGYSAFIVTYKSNFIIYRHIFKS